VGLPNPIAITYGGFTVGGTTGYQLLGPYVIDKSYDGFRLVFDVLITADTLGAVQGLSEALEDQFRRRLEVDEELVIDLGGVEWVYHMGRTLLSVTAEITKTGNRDTDKGLSRAYTCVVTGEMPADQDNGLRDVKVMVSFSPSRQRTITMQGTYTATEDDDALGNYKANFDDVANGYLQLIDTQAKWELEAESSSLDRQRSGSSPLPHICEFTRQYLELLVDQSQGQRDDDQIKDHRVVFTDLSQNPADGQAGIRRLRRVVGTYDCSVDITKTTNLQDVFKNKVKAHLRQLFTTEFSPRTFCLEEQRIGYDETAKRISVQFQFLYQSSTGGNTIEVSESVSYQEQRSLDYTPVHGGDELAYDVDVGWATILRHWQRVVVSMGNETPKRRIAARPSAGAAGLFRDTIGGIAGPDAGGDRSGVSADGWNIVSSTSQVTPQYIGDPDSGQQIQISVLSEVVVERFHKKPATTGPTGPTTPR
jgi:hypothetical protein